MCSTEIDHWCVKWPNYNNGEFSEVGNIFSYVASSNEFNTLKATFPVLLLLKCSALIIFLLSFNLELHLENSQGKKASKQNNKNCLGMQEDL